MWWIVLLVGAAWLIYELGWAIDGAPYRRYRR
jgi:hypothetical protein